MSMSPWLYFTDPILRAPTIGSMLMCLSASLIGVIVFLRKQSLLGESLSHAAYPGVILGVMVAGSFGLTEDYQAWLSILIIAGAFLSAFLGLSAIHFLETRFKIRSDSALCFVLSSFFGIGLTLGSQVQFFHSSLYRQIQAYLYGQAATMTDVHIWIYGSLSLLIIIAVALFFKELETITFDRNYAKSLGFPVRSIEMMTFTLTVLAIIIGIRSVGVVLMSAMIIAPAAAARQFTNRFLIMLCIAPLFGMLSGFLGNYLSIELSQHDPLHTTGARFALPTGPTIVIVASLLCLLAIFFAPERGLLLRVIRIARFRFQCICENVLKTIWRLDPEEEYTLDQISRFQPYSSLYLRFVLWRLVRHGWVQKPTAFTFKLTKEGRLWAAKIVRLHRLWEVYLAHYIGIGDERVHRNAEEMEHILTPELEQDLIVLLNDPKVDPHAQPIPPKEF